MEGLKGNPKDLELQAERRKLGKLSPKERGRARIGWTTGKGKEEGRIRPLAKENHQGAGIRLQGRGKEPVLKTEKGETHSAGKGERRLEGQPGGKE